MMTSVFQGFSGAPWPGSASAGTFPGLEAREDPLGRRPDSQHGMSRARQTQQQMSAALGAPVKSRMPIGFHDLRRFYPKASIMTAVPSRSISKVLRVPVAPIAPVESGY